MLLAFCLASVLGSRPGLARQDAAVVLDYETGALLHADEPDATAFPASLTKVMTLYMVFQALESGRLEPETRLRVSARAAAMPATKLGLKAGSRLRVEDAIMGLITRSANDAAAVVGEALGGSEDRFAEMMTTTARRLGMSSTTFRNASGLPDAEQATTARDMAILAHRLIRDFPQHYDRFSQRRFKFAGRQISNHNRLLTSYEGADGIKTGYTRGSGYNLMASASRDGRRLIGVVLGERSASSRDRRMRALLDRGFSRSGKGAPLLTASFGPSPAQRPPTPVAAPGRDVVVASNERVIDAKTARALAQTVATMTENATKDDTESDLPRQQVAAIGGEESASAARPRSAGKVVPVSSRPPANPYGIHIGTFRSVREAQRSMQLAIRRAPSLLQGTFASVGQVRGPLKRTDYRAQLIGLSRDGAQASCRALRKYRQTCAIVRTAAISVAAN